jgi:hypothetical protein
MKYLIFIALYLSAFKVNAQEEEYKKKSPVFERIIKNMSFEVMGMRSIVLQKEPYPYMKITPTTGFISTGYIPRPSYSSQIGVFKCVKLFKAFYLNTGIQFKMLNYKYELVDTPIIVPGINTTRFFYAKQSMISVTNYLVLKQDPNLFAIGIVLYDQNIVNSFSLLHFKNVFIKYSLRYERNIKRFNNYEIHLLTEIESQNQKNDYYLLKLGISLKKN